MTKNNGTSATLDTIADDMTEEQSSGITPLSLTEYEGPARTENEEEEANYRALVWKLEEPLDRARIKKRKGFDDGGPGKELSYLDHPDVTRTANKLFGYGHWSQRTLDIKEYYDTTAEDGVPRAVRVTVEVQVTAPGFSYEPMSDVAYEVVKPRKNTGKYTWAAFGMALSNAKARAFKRAMAQYGDQFGLSLYDGDDEADQVEDLHLEREAKPTSGGSKPEIVNGVAHCEGCNKDIKGYTNRTTGKTYTTEDLVTMSKKQSGGHILCLDCRQKRAGD